MRTDDGPADDVPPAAALGFEIVNRTPPYPMLARDELFAGALVLYEGTATTPGGSLKHFFISDAGNGYRFAVWGTPDLNAKLIKMPTRAVLFLRYEGHSASQEEPNREHHVYTVARARTDVQITEGRKVWQRLTQRLHDTLGRQYVREWGGIPETVEFQRQFGAEEWLG